MCLGEGSSFFPWTVTKGNCILSAWWMYNITTPVLNRGSEATSRRRRLFFLFSCFNSILRLFRSASTNNPLEKKFTKV